MQPSIFRNTSDALLTPADQLGKYSFEANSCSPEEALSNMENGKTPMPLDDMPRIIARLAKNGFNVGPALDRLGVSTSPVYDEYTTQGQDRIAAAAA